ncbi:MAG: glycosyltransferase family 39 protein, partial [Chloroflexota bacterium]|nr:glycosyltransferase family 39 protein [Chloroflexota bacterium]
MTDSGEGVGAVAGAQPESRWLFRMSRRQMAVAFALALIVLLGAFLRFYELGAHSVGNTYYAATVQSMLTSWHNFFFASFEPGGSVSVDKPPLGFWVQAASAYVFGVNGFALALPQALAGVLSIPLLYALVKRQFGVWAGLIAALVLAIMPVTVATERNNTIDGLLVFVLLLATWAFLRAVSSGRLRDLLLGVLLIGLGFNIKMLQAFMALPALYALYLLGAPHSWRKRIVSLAGATVVLLAVSLSWALAVDLTPAESRPYVGSSTNNTVMELITGHNGLRRVTGAGGPAPSGGGAPFANDGPAGDGSPGGQFPMGADLGGGLRNAFAFEVGEPGALRLFTEPLVTQASWLLPLALLGIPLIMVLLGWRWPLGDKHLALVLWVGWLLPEIVFFSFTSGIFHSFYVIMLGPPLAALVGATAWALGSLFQRQRRLGWLLLGLLTGITVAFQIVTLQNYPEHAPWITAIAAVAWLVGVGLLAWRSKPWLGKVALALVCASLAVAPLTWSALTTLDSNPNVLNAALPRAGPSTSQEQPPGFPATMGGVDMPLPPVGGTSQKQLPGYFATLSAAQEELLDYLLANTDPDSYLIATPSAMDAAPLILATKRPVLTFGGFTGLDNVVDVERLAKMTADGEL